MKRILDRQSPKDLSSFLGQYLTPDRRQRIAEVIENRTYRLAVVLEDVYQEQNASAALRSCEGLGIQNVYIIENDNPYQVSSKVSMGADQWLSLHRFCAKNRENTRACVRTVKEQGYTIIAATPENKNPQVSFEYLISALAKNKNLALFFGNEEKGLSTEALEAAEGYLRLDMYGFTPSFNISVSVALALSFLVRQMRHSGMAWQVASSERERLKLEFYRRSLRHHVKLEKLFYSSSKTE